MSRRSKKYAKYNLNTAVPAPHPASPVLQKIDDAVIPSLTSAIASAATKCATGFTPLPKGLQTFVSATAAYSSYNASAKNPITLSSIWGVIKQNKLASTLVGLAVAGTGIATGAAVTAVTSIPALCTPMTLLSLLGKSEVDAIILNQTQKLELSTGVTVVAQSLAVTIGANTPAAYAVLGAKKVLEMSVARLQAANASIDAHEEELRSSFDRIAGYD